MPEQTNIEDINISKEGTREDQTLMQADKDTSMDGTNNNDELPNSPKTYYPRRK